MTMMTKRRNQIKKASLHKRNNQPKKRTTRQKSFTRRKLGRRMSRLSSKDRCSLSKNHQLVKNSNVEAEVIRTIRVDLTSNSMTLTFLTNLMSIWMMMKRKTKWHSRLCRNNSNKNKNLEISLNRKFSSRFKIIMKMMMKRLMKKILKCMNSFQQITNSKNNSQPC